VFVDAVDEACDVGELGRNNKESLICVFTVFELHDTVVWGQQESLAVGVHIADVLTYEHSGRQRLIGEDIVATLWAVMEGKGPNGLFFVFVVHAHISIVEVLDSEVDAVLAFGEEGAVVAGEFLGVLHVLGEDGKEEVLFVFEDLLSGHLWELGAEAFVGGNDGGLGGLADGVLRFVRVGGVRLRVRYFRSFMGCIVFFEAG
jgi:hypothetical protein